MTAPFGGAGRPAPGLPSLPTPPTGWPVGSYATYEEAQRAVDHLADSDFPVRDVTIVGVDLMLVERVLFRFDSVQHYSQSLNELLATIRPRLLDRRRRYFREEAGIFSRVMADGKKTGVFTLKDPQKAAEAVLDATNALLPYSLSAYELGEREELEKKASNVADLILNGLKKR